MRAVLWLCVTAPLVGQDDRAFVEVTAPRDSYYVQERIELELRFGFERAFLRDNLVQLFRQQLDVPARVDLPLAELPGVVSLSAFGAGDGQPRLTFVFNDEVCAAPGVATIDPGSRSFTTLTVRGTILGESAGTLALPAPTLRYAFATKFRDDFVNGRVAEDRQDGVVSGEPLSLTIRPLPDEGRPEGFTNAVGRFAVAAEAEPRALEVKQSFKLAIHITGEGNLRQFEPPRLEPLDGFHVFGSIESGDAGRRTITYDLAPLSSEVSAVPAIAFAFFDPGSGFDVVRTEPIPLEVTGDPVVVPDVATDPDPAPTPDAVETAPVRRIDLADLKPVVSRGAAPSVVALWVLLVAPWLLAVGLVSWRRVQQARARDPEGKRARAAGAVFRARDPEGDLTAAFIGFLAAHLRCQNPAVVAPELPDRLVAAGVSADVAHRTATVLDALIGNRFGGDGSVSAEQVGALVATLEAELG